MMSPGGEHGGVESDAEGDVIVLGVEICLRARDECKDVFVFHNLVIAVVVHNMV